MTVGRRIGLVVTVLLGLSGCRAAGTGSLALHPRTPSPTPSSFDVARFVADYNRNAERIQSLEAKPSIRLATSKRQLREYHLDGRMALERPRNFELQLAAFSATKADIGSNDQEFWFWVSNDEDKSIYWCNHEDLGSNTLPLGYQPDWIIAALGLKPISPEEAERIQLRRGTEPGTTALVFPTTRNQSQNVARVVIVTNQDRRIQKYQLRTADLQTVLAQAEPSRYREYAVSSGDSASGQTCVLPERIRLEWKQDGLAMDIALRDVVLNQFNPARRSTVFVEPSPPGYTRKNLAELTGGAREERPTRTRQTLSPPEPSSGVKLGRPAPLSDETPVVPRLGRASVRPRDTAPPMSPPEELVGTPVPSPPVSRAAQAASSELSQVDSFGSLR
jgi:hypothetical protein